MSDIEDPVLYETPSRLPTADAAVEYIADIDFTELKRMMGDERLGGMGWSPGKLDYVEHQYKRWLILRRKYEGVTLPPSEDIDKFWHYHILDTRTYLRDCHVIFGYYLHHFPYLGIRGEDDWVNLERAYADTERLYTAEFNDDIYDFEEAV
jgi:hypothetical protein